MNKPSCCTYFTSFSATSLLSPSTDELPLTECCSKLLNPEIFITVSFKEWLIPLSLLNPVGRERADIEHLDYSPISILRQLTITFTNSMYSNRKYFTKNEWIWPFFFNKGRNLWYQIIQCPMWAKWPPLLATSALYLMCLIVNEDNTFKWMLWQVMKILNVP